VEIEEAAFAEASAARASCAFAASNVLGFRELEMEPLFIAYVRLGERTEAGEVSADVSAT